jgi:ribosomal protein L18E
MNRKKAIIGILMVAMFVMMAFYPAVSSTPQKVDNIQPTGYASKNWEKNALLYAYNKWGNKTGKLAQLEYRSNVNFIKWYHKMYSKLPQNNRNLTASNLSSILTIYEHSDRTGYKLSNEITEYEASRQMDEHKVNISKIVEYREGKAISHRTTIRNNKTAIVTTYIYHSKNETVKCAIMKQGNKTIALDPYVSLGVFKISKGWWIFKIYATSYNIYYNFYNYNGANQFEHYITETMTITAIVDDIFTAIVYAMLDYGAAVAGSAAWALIIGVGGTLACDLLGTTTPTAITNNFKTLFENEWDYSKDFRLVFTLNVWEGGLVPQFAVWGSINPGNSLFEAFDSIQPLTGGQEITNYLQAFESIESKIGTNNQQYIANPTCWSSFSYSG